MFGRSKNKAPKRTTVVHKTGWTGDPDTEGLFEENFLVAIIIGISLLVFAVIGYFVGFDINLAWFEGQNFWSTAGIIILVIFIPAIAFSTFTGRSDLIAAEAIFILVGFGMIYLAHNFDLSEFLNVFQSDWFNLGNFDFNVSTLLTIVLIAAIIVAVIGGVLRGSGISASIVIIVCGIGIFVINSPDPGNVFHEVGEALGGATSGFIGADIGAAAASGITGGLAGAAAGALAGSVVPGLGTVTGAIIGFIAGAAGGTGGSFAGWW
ncbi:MAG: hypothetical protein ACTSPB_17115 [Candidatus Thorarchaeota archaeon]